MLDTQCLCERFAPAPLALTTRSGMSEHYFLYNPSCFPGEVRGYGDITNHGSTTE